MTGEQRRGSIRERRPGFYEVRVHVGRDDTGRKLQVGRSVEGTRADAERLAQQLLKEHPPIPRPQRQPRKPQRRTGTRTVDAPPKPHPATNLPAERLRHGRWPMAPLWRLTPGATARQRALRLGVGQTQAQRWLTIGLTDERADELATALGLHPLEVWPDWCDVAQEMAG